MQYKQVDHHILLEGVGVGVGALLMNESFITLTNISSKNS